MEKVCCVCNRVKTENDWVKDASRLVLGKVTHSYCPDCYREAMRKVLDFGMRFQPAID